ncbi:transposase [Nitrosovibrio sp. Nv6]|uniref:REP-associated tyrosine transposase n=1 Tax=Nitrosovibrio sp. Nv6 TaxID=1855340 RepID=UPI0008AE9033|nr:transposase [Nitrosovibrio sp. Nv6]SEP08696.1 putative transposase [Nitrosovibrio sp. Nv6]
MRYRRANVKGGTYFFTVNLLERRRTLLVDHVDALHEVIREVRARHPFQIDAMVILPDHLHALWTMTEGDADFSMRWMLIKAGFSRLIPKGEPCNASRQMKGERGIWQRRYWEHLIRDDRDFARHVNYIHYNPVKHGHAHKVADWRHSTFHEYVQRGIYSSEWAGAITTDATGNGFGE